MKHIALALAILMLLSITFVSCDNLADSGLFEGLVQDVGSGIATTAKAEQTEKNKEKPNKDKEKETTAKSEDPPKTPEEEPDLPDTPVQDFQGVAVRIMHFQETLASEFVWELTDGDRISQLLYQRNAAIQEKYNVLLEFIVEPATNLAKIYQMSVHAGEPIADIWGARKTNLLQMYNAGSLCDLTKTEGIDLSSAGWSQSLIEDMTVNGKLYSVTGMASPNFIYSMPIILCNRDLMAEYNLESLYEVAIKGQWTVEKMMVATEHCYLDRDGDELRTEGDRYGFVAKTSDPQFFTGGMCLYGAVKNSQGLLELQSDVNFLERGVAAITQLFNAKSSYLTTIETALTMFTNNSAVMTPGTVYDLKNYADFNVGVLPLPKLDEKQATYQSTVGLQSVFYSLTELSHQPKAAAVVLQELANTSENISNVFLFAFCQSQNDHAIVSNLVNSVHFDFATDMASMVATAVKNMTPFNVVWANNASKIKATITSFNNAFKA